MSAGKEPKIVWTFFVVLLILWLLGLLKGHTAGGLIHVLLVIAIVLVLVRVTKGRKLMWSSASARLLKDGE